MKLLCVHPGASYATGDVYDGYARALAAQGHEVLPYNLERRIDDAAVYYAAQHRKQRAGRPEWARVVWRASVDAVAFALAHQPDWVLVFSGMLFHPDMLVLMRRAGIRTALILSESPYDDYEQMRIAGVPDVVFTNERASVATLRQVQPHTHYLPHAFDPERSNPDLPIPDDTPRHDVLFIGTLFEERIALLEAVDWSGIDFAIYGNPKLLPSRHRLRKHVRGGVVPNARAQQMYRAAKINLNPYRTSMGYGIGVAHIARAESLNPRALELAACGAFQLSDYRAEQHAVFGNSLTTYTDAAGLEEQVRFWLQWPTLRDHNTAAARIRIAEHTYAARAAQLTATLAGLGVASRDALATAAD